MPEGSSIWDYKIRKMEIAWQLASNVIPKQMAGTGRWSDGSYLKSAQETLKEAFGIVDAVFSEG